MRYDDATLEELAADLESDLVERKQSLKGDAKDEVPQAICAFANDLPSHGRAGVVFVGLTDDGRPSGISVDDKLLTTLGGMHSDGRILPVPSVVVERRHICNADVAVVTVVPSRDPPVQYKGRIYVRRGPRRAIATRDEERILTERRRSLDLPFDHQPVRGTTLDDLDRLRIEREFVPAAVAPEVLAENGRTLTQQLASLHVAGLDGTPNVAGILVLGRSPRDWIPGAYVQFVRFAGNEITDPIADQKEVDGAIPDVLRRLDEIASANVHVATDIGERLVELRQPDYPLVALQQVLRNAVMHRNYETSNAPIQWYWFENRVEIHSPGGLFGRVTEANFGSITDYRNPAIAATMKQLGFVQRFGIGVALTKKACCDNGNPVPNYAFSPAAVVVEIRRRS